MKTARYGNVTRLPDNTEAGYGPSYVSDRGRGWLVYLADCFDPPVYFLNCDSLEEAYEHALIVLSKNLLEDDDFLGEWDKIEKDDWDAQEKLIYSWGATSAEDGTIRYCETIQMIEVKAVNAANKSGE